MLSKNKNRIFLVPYIVAAAVLITYTAFRAYVISFTHDEAISYLAFKTFYAKVLEVKHIENATYLSLEINRITHLFNANNHIINTMLMKLCSMIFGDAEWSMRLPNVMAHIFFIYYTYRVFTMYSDKRLLSFAAFIILNTNPFLLDFFSLARGYGISVCLAMGSLYYFLSYLRGDGGRHITYSYILSMLAVYANFTLFNYHLALIVTHAVYYVSSGKAKLTASTIKSACNLKVIANILFISITGVILVALNAGDQLYVGSSSLFGGTLLSLARASMYMKATETIVTVTAYVAILIMLIAIGGCIVYILKMKGLHYVHGPVLMLLFLLCIYVAEHVLLHTPYPEYRTALYLIPLFVTCMLFLERHIGIPWLHKVYTCALIGVAALSVYNLTNAANDKYVLYAPYDANTKTVFYKIESLHPNEPAKVCTEWIFEPAMNYYRVSRKYEQMPQVSRYGEKLPECNYLYYSKDSMGNALGVRLATYDDTHSILIKTSK
jgi:hypothetical protein